MQKKAWEQKKERKKKRLFKGFGGRKRPSRKESEKQEVKRGRGKLYVAYK